MVIQEKLPSIHNDLSNASKSSHSSGTETNFESATVEQLEYRDPAQWPRVLSEYQQNYLVEKGPHCAKHQNYPIDSLSKQTINGS